nr:BLUF domain-containing protein [Variovorax sp. PCZ-1]
MIYGSQIAPQLELPEIFSILKQAQVHNARAGISGVLLFNTRFFMQLLEGPELAVDQLYSRIEQDKRHVGIKLISRQTIKQRAFQHWSMALVTPGVNNLEILQKYCKSQDFSPLALSANQARGLLNELTAASPPSGERA